MIENISSEGEIKHKIQEIIVENACQEYKNIVKNTLNFINTSLEEALVDNYEGLEELEEKIAARTIFLEKNPTFLSALTYNTENIKSEHLQEFDEIKITLKEHSRRINEKVEKIEEYHRQLLNFVAKNNKEEQKISECPKIEDVDEELFQDCFEEDKEKIYDDETVAKILESAEKLLEPENETSEEKVTQPKEEEKQTEVQEEKPEIQEEKPAEIQEEKPDIQEKKQEIQEKKLSSQYTAKREHVEAESVDSFDKVTIIKNAYSDMTLNTKLVENLPTNFQLFPDVPADVQRRRALEDLHAKLIQQLEASDSLEGFIKLMERRPSLVNKKKTKKNEDIQDKYNGSLWFFSEKETNKKVSKNTLPTTPSQKSTKITKSSKHQEISASNCRNLLTSSSQNPTNSPTRKAKSNLERGRLKCYDLLDDLERKDLKPIRSEYPRRDTICFNKGVKLHDAKTYLHLMTENEKVLKKLIQPPPKAKKGGKSKKKTEEHKNKSKKVEEIKKPSTPREEESVEKKIKPTKSVTEEDDNKSKNNKITKNVTDEETINKMKNNKKIKNLIEYLTAPEQKFLNHRPQSLIVMPVKVIYDNFPTKENYVSQFFTDLTKPIELPKTTETNKSSPKKIEYKRIISPRTGCQRKKEMLDHLKGLKTHNNSIQKNIQKAIDVIEEKMIDLVSSSNDTNNAEAFNVMEQEISTVLKMINEAETKAKVEKVEAEKDETHSSKAPPKSPKLKRGFTMVKRNNNSGEQPLGDDVPAEAAFQKSKKTKDQKNKKEEPGKVVKIDEVRRAANIEEGERLLGQVDSVIKKIDDIYLKFYEESKQAKPVVIKKQQGEIPEQKLQIIGESTFSDLIEYFDDMKTVKEPLEVEYQLQEAHSYCEANVYHEACVKFTPNEVTEEKVEESNFKNEELKNKEEINLDAFEKVDAGLAPVCEEKMTIPVNKKLHRMFLTRFYCIFFSIILAMLNFNFVA